ncbi:putative glycosyltransferase [Heterostelium album PN500]|uniref:Putative glycosyltransferase n=1 Tax=Heterostelium pallidum (strain ATCC 26659 / Pp 5 / PN500) TaxID=670386 RepID=D3B879_HETP5|nr:putative glycosyltransferase [Heterostelium album PN500]EFA82247.1 putative glycosyltransferase [Heterostelium album PN500]|eukprot:XP_020434364.1 putative glycosyltransferase [Heterostelium album PN500]
MVMNRIRLPRNVASMKTRNVIIGLLIICMSFYMIISNLDGAKGSSRGRKLGFGLGATFRTEPYYYNRQDVSVDRLERLAWMADKWRAPISAAVYIQNDTEIEAIANLIRGSYSVTQFVDIHLLYANNTRYPINTLRNLSIKHAETDWVLLMDADFIPPISLYKNIVQHTYKVPRDELTAFVIPSFASSLDRFKIPDDKLDLLKEIKKKTIVPTNLNVCPKCHTPSNYTRWYKEKDTYEAKYQWVYEPYLVYRKIDAEPFDERLKGYGFDKNSQVFGMAVKGFKFVVLPECWIVHMNHPKQVWEGTDSYDEQMVCSSIANNQSITFLLTLSIHQLTKWDSLKIVCEILPETKKINGYNPEEILFNEPTKEKCYTREHCDVNICYRFFGDGLV